MGELDGGGSLGMKRRGELAARGSLSATWLLVENTSTGSVVRHPRMTAKKSSGYIEPTACFFALVTL